MCRKLCLLICIFFTGLKSFTQNLEAYTPTREEIMERYRFAAFSDSTINRGKIFNTTVQPVWFPDGKSFLYRRAFKDSVREYVRVYAENGKKKPLFNHQKVAAAVSSKTGKSVHPQKLQLTNIEIRNAGKEILFDTEGKTWLCRLSDSDCRDTVMIRVQPQTTPQWRRQNPLYRSRWISYRTDSISPDRSLTAVIKNNNIYITDHHHKDRQLTFDGSEAKPYGSLAWSPDSRFLVGYRLNPYKDSLVYYINTSVENTTRGVLRSQSYKQPGDPFTTYEMFVFDVATGKITEAETETIDFFPAPLLTWNKNNHSFLFERVDRGHQRFRIVEVNAETGKTRTVADEKTETFIYEQKIFTHYLPETNEILWTSEKDGWRHLYLVQTETGEIHPVTSGKWVVREIDSIDKKNRMIWFRASGMNPDEDPYYVHYYRIGFDGSNLVHLTPSDGHHSISYSPDRKYYLDTYSQVHIPPVIELRRTSDGKKIMEVERADISHYLAAGFRLPEPFTAKGRDGVTDIWGVVFRPTRFDSTRKYPVIENIYAGPQDSFVPKSFTTGGEMQSMAELGFIVVQIDGMGTSNRSKAFHDVCWKNLADAGFADRILWIQALAKKYPYVDAEKVGLYGTSAGGQNALGGLLFHPEFYKAAVSSCGCHDNRVDKQWWNEQWMGYPVGKHYEEQSNVTNAYKLQGDLLLIVGEEDTNVPPESTYRVADALIKSGKQFDFLAIPGLGHSDGGPYGKKKKRDFFVKSLYGIDPPNRNKGEL